MDIFTLSDRGLTIVAGATLDWPALVGLPLIIIALIAVIFLIIGGKYWAKLLLIGGKYWAKLPPLPKGIKALYVFATCLAPIWLALLVVVLSMLYRIVVTMPSFDETGDGTALRWHVLALVGLLTALGGLVGAPLALIRVTATERQTVATEQGLVTDRINAAVASLGAEKETSRIGRAVRIYTGESRNIILNTDDPTDYRLPSRSVERRQRRGPFEFPPQSGEVHQWEVDYTTWPEEKTVIEWKGETTKVEGDEHLAHVGDWQVFRESLPNMEVRIGAILALGRIARENLGFHVQVMEILCAYVRENAPAKNAMPFTLPQALVKDVALTPDIIKAYETELQVEISAFRERLPKPRTDIQTALETIGRRTVAQKRKEGAWPDADGAADCLFDAPFPVPPAYPANDDATAHKAWSATFATFKQAADARRTAYALCRHYRPDLRNTNLQGHDMCGLDLRGARLNGAQMQGAYLTGAPMQGADLIGAQIQGADLSAAQMQGADLIMVQMQGADLFGAQMQGADLLEAQMQGADLIVAQMQGAVLNRAQMQGTVLSGAQMQGAFLSRAQMQRADLREAQMQGAVLIEAQMQGADLSEMQMSEDTDLTDANLKGAALRSVDETTLAKLRPFWGDIFADGTLREHLPAAAPWPTHWPTDELDFAPFYEAWREWAATLDPPVTIAHD